MRLKTAEQIRPTKDLVVVEIQSKEDEDELYIGEEEANPFQVEMYYGVVEHLGPETRDDLHCPNLNKGDIVIFSQFAGSYIATNDDKLYKVIRGYDIMATTTILTRINEDALTPTADRVLVKVHDKSVDESGLYLSTEEQKDSRLVDLNYGEIIKVGPTVPDTFKQGDLVAYDSYSGEAIRRRGSSEEPELRVIRSPDILFVNEGF